MKLTRRRAAVAAFGAVAVLALALPRAHSASAAVDGASPYGQYVVCVTTIDAAGRERPDSYYQLAQDARARQWQIIHEGWGPALRSPYDPHDPTRWPYPTDSYPPSSIIRATVDYRGDGDICPPDGDPPPADPTVR